MVFCAEGGLRSEKGRGGEGKKDGERTFQTNSEVLTSRTSDAIADTCAVPFHAAELVFENAEGLFCAHEDD